MVLRQMLKKRAKSGLLLIVLGVIGFALSLGLFPQRYYGYVNINTEGKATGYVSLLLVLCGIAQAVGLPAAWHSVARRPVPPLHWVRLAAYTVGGVVVAWLLTGLWDAFYGNPDFDPLERKDLGQMTRLSFPADARLVDGGFHHQWGDAYVYAIVEMPRREAGAFLAQPGLTRLPASKAEAMRADMSHAPAYYGFPSTSWAVPNVRDYRVTSLDDPRPDQVLVSLDDPRAAYVYVIDD